MHEALVRIDTKMSERPQQQPSRFGARERPRVAYWHPLDSDEVVATLDCLTDGIAVIGADWRCRYINEPGAAVFGRTAQGLIGKNIFDELPGAVGRPFHLAYERAFREQRPITVSEYEPTLDRWFENRILPRGDELVIVFRDISDQQAVKEELRHYAERMKQAESIARFGVWEWDVSSGRVTWSDELHRIYGLRPGEFGGTLDSFLAFVAPEDRELVQYSVGQAVDNREPFVFEERIRRADGLERVLLSQGRVIEDSDGRVKAVVGICHDVTDRADAERELGRSERRTRAIIDNTPSVVAVKDLEGRYLMTNAETERLLGVPADQLVGRECVELFPPDVGEQLRRNDRRAAAEGEPVFDETVLYRNGEPRTFVTVTFALPDSEGRPVETCTIGTDVTERRERESERRERLAWEERIRSALSEGRFAAFGQPVVDLTNGHSGTCELLARMVPPDDHGGVMEPASFLPAAERFGLIQDIDVWMVEQALRVAAHMNPEVNLSAVSLSDPGVRQTIVGLLSAQPGLASRIVFEITETATMGHLEAAVEFAAELTELGCGLALDDFGTGFGSFTYLRRLPLRYLKIDRSFVSNLPRSSDDRRVVQSIIDIAERFGLKTIAEGVEDDATLELVQDLGADYAQGFHLGKPAPIELHHVAARS
jgi:PAS domain S-box-containing protein